MSLIGNPLFIFPTPESWNFENSRLLSAWAIVAVSDATHSFSTFFAQAQAATIPMMLAGGRSGHCCIFVGHYFHSRF